MQNKWNTRTGCFLFLIWIVFQAVAFGQNSGFPSSSTASSYHVFPQFADGRLGDRIYRTTLMISASANYGAVCGLQLRGFALPGFSLSYNLGDAGQASPHRGWVINQSSGAGPFQSGYATLQCSAEVEAQLLYSIYRTDGIKVGEATVFSSRPSTHPTIIADERDGAALGLAIANDSDAAVTYTIAVTNAPQSGTLTLPPRSNVAKFVAELVPGVPAGNLGIVTLTPSAGGAASVIGLRFINETFTTVPTNIAVSTDIETNRFFIFPQFADGIFPDGAFYRTTRLYYNPNATNTVYCKTALNGMTSDGQRGFTDVIPAASAVVAATAGSQPLQSGSATTECRSPVDATYLYTAYTPGGLKVGEATVFPSSAAIMVQILADTRGGARIGLAIANSGDSTAFFNILAQDASGFFRNVAGRFQLPPQSSVSRFLDELPPDYLGPVWIQGDFVSVIGFRYSGSVFTTLPGIVLIANISPVKITDAVTLTGNGAPSTSFLQGDTLRLKMTLFNSAKVEQQVTVRHRVLSVSNHLLVDWTTRQSIASAANVDASLDVPIPCDVPAGTYIYDATITWYLGEVRRKSTSFSLDTTSCSVPAIVVTRVFTSTPSGIESTTFARGETVILNMVVDNHLGFVTVTRELRTSLGTGWGLAPTMSGVMGPGIRTFGINLITAGSPAPALGSYTFQGSVMYNGLTSSKTVTYTLVAPTNADQ